jgi:IrrE N-terminal-like domain
MVNDVLDQRVRQRSLEVIRRLPIPRPFDLERFRIALGRRRERTLRFIPARTTARSADGPDGLWVATANADHIFYDQDATPLRQLHIIAREIGHMVLEHQGAPASVSEIARLLLPSLDPALIVATLGRTSYTLAEEQEADLFAALLLDHMETASLLVTVNHCPF